MVTRLPLWRPWNLAGIKKGGILLASMFSFP